MSQNGPPHQGTLQGGDAASLIMEEAQRIAYYETRPVQFMIDLLGFAPESLYWSMNPGYEKYIENPNLWDSTIQFPGDKVPRPCPNPLVAFARAWALGYQQIAIESATGTGKTFLVAAMMLWNLDTRRPSIVRSYAPTKTSLEENMWKYVGEQWIGLNQARGFGSLHPHAVQTKDLHVYMEPDATDRAAWSATGYLAEVSSGGQVSHGAESAAGAQGGHAEHMTLVVEEATGVDPRIWNALDFTLSDETNQLIALGSPDS
ncbi:MAG: hypothetical protein GVY29_05125, partial [Spirochaetes bacterium]|nr:hypothetical protein [Spirochaetota bacterium]